MKRESSCFVNNLWWGWQSSNLDGQRQGWGVNQGDQRTCWCVGGKRKRSRLIIVFESEYASPNVSLTSVETLLARFFPFTNWWTLFFAKSTTRSAQSKWWWVRGELMKWGAKGGISWSGSCSTTCAISLRRRPRARPSDIILSWEPEWGSTTTILSRKAWIIRSEWRSLGRKVLRDVQEHHSPSKSGISEY